MNERRNEGGGWARAEQVRFIYDWVSEDDGGDSVGSKARFSHILPSFPSVRPSFLVAGLNTLAHPIRRLPNPHLILALNSPLLFSLSLSQSHLLPSSSVLLKSFTPLISLSLSFNAP